MKKLCVFLTIAILILFASSMAMALNLVCDPQAGVTHYYISGDAFWAAAQSIPAQPDGSLKSSVESIPSGVHNIEVRACAAGINYPVEVCSDSTPFSFTKPSAPGAPGGLKLAP